MKEQVSALMDGELEDGSAQACIKALGQDGALRREWDLYHLVGDAMRGHLGAALPRSFDERLHAEPTVLAPRRIAKRRPPAWTALSAAASVAAVAYVGWLALPMMMPADQIATAPVSVPMIQQATAVETQQAAVIPVATGMSDYVLAHQRFSPAAHMAGTAPYARSLAEDIKR